MGKWLKLFKYFVAGTIITDGTQKMALLLHLVGPNVEQIVDTLEITGEANDFDAAVNSLNSHFQQKKNISFERHQFRLEKQKNNESVQDFCTRLKQLPISCDFADNDEMIRKNVTLMV